MRFSVTDSARVKSSTLLLGFLPDNLVLGHAFSTFGDDGAVKSHHVPLSHLLKPQAHLLDNLLVLSGPDTADSIVDDKAGCETQHPAKVAHVESNSADVGAQTAYEAREWQRNTAEVGDDSLDVPTKFVIVVRVLFTAVVAVSDEDVAAGQAEVFANHDCYH